MCKLFGHSSTHSLAARDLPLPEFRLRGGATADNPDGWVNPPAGRRAAQAPVNPP